MAERGGHALARLDLRPRRSRRARSAPERDRLLGPQPRALGGQLVPASRAEALAAGREVLRLQELGDAELVVAQRGRLVGVTGAREPRRTLEVAADDGVGREREQHLV